MKDRKEVDVSLVFPAYNERENLGSAVRRTMQTLEVITNSYEIIIAEDGSTDGTDRIAASLSSECHFIKHIHSDRRLGRGLALKNAFIESNGEIVVYMDVDLATSIKVSQNTHRVCQKGLRLCHGLKDAS